MAGGWCLAIGLSVCSASLLLVTGSVVAQDATVIARTALDEDGRIVSFDRDVAPIFAKHCLECHNEDDAKNDFRINDPDSVFSYVEAGDVESSSLFVDYLSKYFPPWRLTRICLSARRNAWSRDWPSASVLIGQRGAV